MFWIGSCHWAGQAVFGLAILIAAESALVFWRKNTGLRKGLYLAMVLTAELGILTPGTLISLCRMDSMRCRAVMQPAMVILFAAAGLAALLGALFCMKEQKGKK